MYCCCFVSCSILLGVFYGVLPDKDSMDMLKSEHHAQYNYINTNLLFYIISASLSIVLCLVFICSMEIGSILRLAYSFYYMCVLIWNLCNTTTVNGKEWKSIVDNSHELSVLHKFDNIMLAMFWVRVAPCIIIGCTCSCAICCLSLRMMSGFS